MDVAVRSAELHGVLAELHRHRVEVEPGQPGLLGRLAERRAGERGVAGLDVAAELEPAPGLGVQGEQHLRRRPALSTRVLAVRWSGRQVRASPSGCASRWAT